MCWSGVWSIYVRPCLGGGSVVASFSRPRIGRGERQTFRLRCRPVEEGGLSLFRHASSNPRLPINSPCLDPLLRVMMSGPMTTRVRSCIIDQTSIPLGPSLLEGARRS